MNKNIDFLAKHALSFFVNFAHLGTPEPPFPVPPLRPIYPSSQKEAVYYSTRF